MKIAFLIVGLFIAAIEVRSSTEIKDDYTQLFNPQNILDDREIVWKAIHQLNHKPTQYVIYKIWMDSLQYRMELAHMALQMNKISSAQFKPYAKRIKKEMKILEKIHTKRGDYETKDFLHNMRELHKDRTSFALRQ